MLYAFGKMVTYWYVRLAFRMRYEGLENIPDSGFILASNHRSFNDPLFIAHKIARPVRYMAKIELFGNKLFGWILRGLHAFPVARGSGGAESLEKARKILQSGGILGMFPEGTRSKDGKPLRARSGVALLAGQTGADVLPCAVCYGETLRFRTAVTVRYGQLIPAETLGIDPENRSTIRAGSKQIMDAIVGLLDKSG